MRMAVLTPAKSGAGSAIIDFNRSTNVRSAAEMSLSWIDWDTDDVTVIALTGRITLGEGTSRLREAVRQALDRGRNKIVLNLGEVMYLDSSGLGEMVHSLTTVRAEGGQLKLAKLQSLTRDLIRITRLFTVFEVFPDDESAVKSFHQPA
jgi:anti-sigma B factor antagonist